jgi:hypothetical protein
MEGKSNAKSGSFSAAASSRWSVSLYRYWRHCARGRYAWACIARDTSTLNFRPLAVIAHVTVYVCISLSMWMSTFLKLIERRRWASVRALSRLALSSGCAVVSASAMVWCGVAWRGQAEWKQKTDENRRDLFPCCFTAN